MTPFESLQAKTYYKVEESAKSLLDCWPETVMKLKNEGYTDRQIADRLKTLKLNSKGVFR